MHSSFSRIDLSPRSLQWRPRGVAALLVLALFPRSPAAANPQGGIIVHGDVRMSGGAGALTVHQSGRDAIIDWASFSIDEGEVTRFVQPDAHSAVLNRVTGGDPSAIHGSLRANGNVFVINPNGILVGPGGAIDAHGVVLSTLDLDNGEFLARNDLNFKGVSSAGVTNLGRVQAIGGDVFLIGRTVKNSGAVRATGTAGLAAGEEVLLTAGEGASGERIFVRARGAGVTGDGIYNDGSIIGAAVEMKSHGNVYALAINNKGSVRATGASHHGGRVTLHAVGGRLSNEGSIRVSGSNASHSAKVLIAAAYARVDGQIRAESAGRGGDIRLKTTEEVAVGGTLDASGTVGVGGRIAVEGDHVEIGSTARIDASGTSGGTVLIGGGYGGSDPEVANASSTTVEPGSLILADASGDGDAGQVAIWADGQTRFEGEISAEAKGSGFGGFVEVSGKERLEIEGTVSTLSTDPSRNGSLLLDPTDFEIVTGTAGANQITAAALVSLLGGGNVIVSTLDAGVDAGEAGDISVMAGANVAWNNPNSLTLLAHRHIRVGANLRNSGTGGIHLIAGWDGFAGMPASAGAKRIGGVLRGDSLASDSFGHHGGSVYIGDGEQNQRISVGSKSGDTQVAAYDLVLASRDAEINSPHRNAQLGFFDGTNAGVPSGTVHAGDLWVHARNDIVVKAGTNARAWAQIGHGGNVESVVTAISSYTGDITLRADHDVHLEAPQMANPAARSYAQIGHGGAGNGGMIGGDIRIEAGREVRLSGAAAGNWAYTQIGHGGFESHGVVTGLIQVEAGEKVALAGVSGSNAYTQIGHGGLASTASIDGAIRVSAGLGGISAVAGSGLSGYAQIGHGGALAQALSHRGAIKVDSEGEIRFDRNTGSGIDAYAMIGHGGTGAHSTKSGDISVVSSGGDVLFGTGIGRTGRSAVQIGHGGRGGSGDTQGSIDVSALSGDIRFHGVLAEGNNGHREGYAQIGHGGRENQGNHGVSGDQIRVGTGGDLEFFAGGSTVENEAQQGRDAYAQLGHGGYQSNGNHTADLVVDAAGEIRFDTRGSSGDRAYVQLGHGGYFSSGRFVGDIAVNQQTAGGSIAFLAGRTASYAQLGHGGRNDHDSTRDNSGSDGVNNTADDMRILVNPDYVSGTIHGDIAVRASGDITFTGGFGVGATGFAQIGHGGHHQDAEAGEGHSGDIRVISNAGAITLRAGSRNSQHAMIGHGGEESFGNHRGNILVEAARGISLVADGGAVTVGSGDVRSFAQIGHGGVDSDFALNRGIAAVGVVNGAAGFHPSIPKAEPGIISGSITVRTSGPGSEIVLRGSQGGANLGLRGYSQIGHGGLLNEGTFDGDIMVASGGGVSLLGGTERDSHAQIGHGGGLGVGDRRGDVRVDAASDLLLRGGGITTSYAIVGHGGLSAAGAATAGMREGDLLLHVGGETRLEDHQSQATIGHLGGAENARLSIVTGRLDASATHAGVTGLIGHAIRSGTVELVVGSGDLLIDGASVRYNSPYALNLVASGSVHLGSGIQNDSSGAIQIAAGWDEFTGLTDRMGSAAESLDFLQVEFDRLSWGGNAGQVFVGDGNQSSAVEVGSRYGETTVLGYGIVLSGGSEGQDRSSQIGYHASGYGVIDGRIKLGLGRGGLVVRGGDGAGSHAHVGHSGTTSILLEGEIGVNNGGGNIQLEGGAGDAAYALLGHGGLLSGAKLAGDLTFSGVTGRVDLNGGAGAHAFSQIGHGGSHAWEDKRGHITIDLAALTIQGGSGLGSSARIGHGGHGGTGEVVGDIRVTSLVGDLGLFGGSGPGSVAQIGHGGTAYLGSLSGESLQIRSAGSVLGVGGSGSQSSVQVGHGGGNAEGLRYEASLILEALAGIRLVSGSGVSAYAQFGHGGASADAGIRGPLSITAGGSIVIQASDPGEGEYAKIGHGDDLRGSSAAQGGRGIREGDLRVIAGADLRISGGLIGHQNHRSPATAGGESTTVAVAVSDPTNSRAGSIFADARSQFSGSGELRFYLPRRSNNLIASGALLNGMAWTGAPRDPSILQREDEFAIHILGENTSSSPKQHTNEVGSGSAPRSPGAFAFYYDTIWVAGESNMPELPGTPNPPGLPSLPGLPEESRTTIDESTSSRLRELLGIHTEAGSTEIRYEGYDLYGPNGEVRFDVSKSWMIEN